MKNSSEFELDLRCFRRNCPFALFSKYIALSKLSHFSPKPCTFFRRRPSGFSRTTLDHFRRAWRAQRWSLSVSCCSSLLLRRVQDARISIQLLPSSVRWRAIDELLSPPVGRPSSGATNSTCVAIDGRIENHGGGTLMNQRSDGIRRIGTDVMVCRCACDRISMRVKGDCTGFYGAGDGLLYGRKRRSRAVRKLFKCSIVRCTYVCRDAMWWHRSVLVRDEP